MVGCQGDPIALGGSPGIAEHGIGRRAATAHRLGDPLALYRVHEAGSVADEEHPPGGRCRTDDAHLEPTTEAPRVA
jgi:hypothetical protein